MQILIQCLMTTLLFLVIDRLQIGVRIECFRTALLATLLFGVLNFIIKPVLLLLTLPLTILTFGHFYFVVNALIFAVAAALVPGFQLAEGFLTAIAGALCLSFLLLLVELVFAR